MTRSIPTASLLFFLQIEQQSTIIQSHHCTIHETRAVVARLPMFPPAAPSVALKVVLTPCMSKWEDLGCRNLERGERGSAACFLFLLLLYEDY